MINYYLITKPGIIFGNLMTLTAGFLLASQGNFDLKLFLATLLGLTLIIASACIFNNYIDRQIDKKMERTKQRPLVTGLISARDAIILATILAAFGNLILLNFTNLLTVFVTNFGFFVYVLLYSFLKSHTVYATAIGSIAGAIPPVVGYCAVSNHFDLGALLLFILLMLWQMPHFFSIALLHLNDYTLANIPVLPVKKGVAVTKMHMITYIFCFALTAPLLTLFHYTGLLYLIVSSGLSLIWLITCIMGIQDQHPQLWGKKMFRLSLLIIISMCLVLPI